MSHDFEIIFHTNTEADSLPMAFLSLEKTAIITTFAPAKIGWCNYAPAIYH